MLRFSANLGFLWAKLSLPDAINRAKSAGFDAVECHFPYAFDSKLVKQALDDTDFDMIGLNTFPGNLEAGDFGLSALPDRISEAREAIEQAVSYAGKIGAKNVHVMAGKSVGSEAHDTFVSNLRFASSRASDFGVNILIEPLNTFDAPGYFLTSTQQALDIAEEVSATNLKIMFDFYHAHRNGESVIASFEHAKSQIGHVQIASSPDRAEPDHGALDYGEVLTHLSKIGYDRPIGAEYRPMREVEDGLGWLDSARLL